MRFGRILVPLDGSVAAEAILPIVEGLASRFEAEVVLIRVVVPSERWIALSPALLEDERVARLRAAKRYLEERAHALWARDVRVGIEVRVGAPAPAIVAAGQELGADLVAMTTHGRGRLRRALFGSVAESVLREAPMPVFLFRATRAGAHAEAPDEPARARGEH